MVTFEFDPSDIEDNDVAECYTTIHHSRSGMEGASVSEMFDMFVHFLKGMGYQDGSISDAASEHVDIVDDEESDWA